MARWTTAIWQPVTTCSGTLAPIAVTLHHQAGWGNPYNVYMSRDVSAHFWLPRSGTPYQHVDTNVRAWHGMAHNDYSIGVETEGCGNPPHADPLTEHQLDLFGELMAWAHDTHGIPLVLSEAVWEPGLNYHRCTGGPATGCPCDERVNSRAEILRRASGDISETYVYGGDGLIIKEANGDHYEEVFNGEDTYWRRIDDGLVQDIPAGAVINDPNGSWLRRWRHPD